MLKVTSPTKRLEEFLGKPTKGSRVDHRSLVGRRYGRLVVVEKTGYYRRESGHGGCIYLCRCDCGGEKQTNSSLLYAGKVKSCGCLKREMGHDALPPGEAGLRTVIRQYKRNARLRNMAFTLSKEEVLSLITNECFYCGDKESNLLKPNKGSVFLYNGIDRMDSSIGYLMSNCVACCTMCNRAKRDFDQKSFIAMAVRIAAKHQVS